MANGDALLVTSWNTGDNSAWLTDFDDTTWSKSFPAGRAGLCMQITGGGAGGNLGSYVEQGGSAPTVPSYVGASATGNDVSIFCRGTAGALGIIRFYHRLTGFPAAGTTEAGRLIQVFVGASPFGVIFQVSLSRTSSGNIIYTLPGGATFDTGSATADSTWRRIELLLRYDTKSCHARMSTVDSNTVLAESVQVSTNWANGTTLNKVRLGFMPNSEALQHATHTHQFADFTAINNQNTAITTWLGDGKIRGPVTATGTGTHAEMCDDATPTTSGTSAFGNLTEAWPTPDQTSFNLPEVGFGSAPPSGLQRDAWAMGNSSGVTGQVIRWGLHTYAAGVTNTNLFFFAGLYSGGVWVEAQHFWTNSDTNWHYGMISGNIADTSTFDAAEVAYRRNVADAGNTNAVQMSAVQVEYEDDQDLTPSSITTERVYAYVS